MLYNPFMIIIILNNVLVVYRPFTTPALVLVLHNASPADTHVSRTQLLVVQFRDIRIVALAGHSVPP